MRVKPHLRKLPNTEWWLCSWAIGEGAGMARTPYEAYLICLGYSADDAEAIAAGDASRE